jgi:hypothetical protein
MNWIPSLSLFLGLFYCEGYAGLVPHPAESMVSLLYTSKRIADNEEISLKIIVCERR